MTGLPNVKAVVIVMADETYITTDKSACLMVPTCFKIPGKIWKRLTGRRPWKAMDMVLDGGAKK